MSNVEFAAKEFISAKAAGDPVTFERIDVTSAKISGREFSFCTDTHRDIVQKTLRSGHFYEQAELEELRSHFPAGGVMADIGANIGNHAMFAAAFWGASRVICFEPSPRAIRLLCANAALNQMSDVLDLSYLGAGLSNETRNDFGMETRGKRLGSLRMLEGQGEIPVISGDSVLVETALDFIKIDVEGMEMQVLDGLKETIQRQKPIIVVEIDKKNVPDFRNWLQNAKYEIVQVFPQNAQVENYLIKSIGKC